MRGQLKGADDLKRRLRAVKVSFKPMGRTWAETTRDEIRRTAPQRTGKLRRSARVKNATMRRATVSAIWYGPIVNRGAKAHAIKQRRAPSLIFQVSGRTIFAKRVAHRGFRGSRFADKAAHMALRKHPLSETLINAWNKAA